MAASGHGLRRALLVSVAATALGCSAPRPSTEPLGWGELTPGMKAAAARAAERTAEREARKAAGKDATKPPPAAAEPVEKPTDEAPPAEASIAPPGAEKPGAGAAAAGLTAEAFVGDYAGEDVSTYRLEGIPERVEKDPNAKITVKSPGEPTIELVLVDSSNGKEICTLTATVAGNDAKIAAGQKCFEQDGGETGASAFATVTEGTAALAKGRLVVDVALDFEMRAGDKAITGTLQYHFDGAKK
jgi:hypothetical protein